MHIRFHHEKGWRTFVNIVLALFILIILADLFFNKELVGMISLTNVELVELILTAILALDLILWYNEARNKYNFLRRNWMKILAIFPFVPVFRFAQMLKLEEFFVLAFSSEMIVDILAMEKLLKLEKSVPALAKVSEFARELKGP